MTDSRRPAANPAAATRFLSKMSSAEPDKAMYGHIRMTEPLCQAIVSGWKCRFRLGSAVCPSWQGR